MARKGRRDCRVGTRKKNNMNARVEEAKKAIRKCKKDGVPVPDNARNALAPGCKSDAAADAAAEEAEVSRRAKTPSATSFLESMRADAAASVAGLKSAAQTSESTKAQMKGGK